MARDIKTIEFVTNTDTFVRVNPSGLYLNLMYFYFPENEVANPINFKSVIAQINIRNSNATASNITNLSGWIDFQGLSSNLFTVTDAIANSGEHYTFNPEYNITDYFNYAFGSGTSTTATASALIGFTTAGSGQNISFKVTCTYEYETSATSDRSIKLVRIPIDSFNDYLLTNSWSELSNSVGSVYDIPALDNFLPEANKTYKHIFLETQFLEAVNNTELNTLSMSSTNGIESTDIYAFYNALNSSTFGTSYTILTTLNTAITGNLFYKSNSATVYSNITPTLNVVYEYSKSATTSVMNSLVCGMGQITGPTAFIDTTGLTLSGAALSGEYFFNDLLINEPNPQFKQSAVQMSFNLGADTSSGIVNFRNFTRNSIFRAGALTCGQSIFQFRVDKDGWLRQSSELTTLTSGVVNRCGFYFFRSTSAVLTTLTNLNCRVILNYTSDIHTQGLHTHNKTIKYLLQPLVADVANGQLFFQPSFSTLSSITGSYFNSLGYELTYHFLALDDSIFMKRKRDNYNGYFNIYESSIDSDGENVNGTIFIKVDDIFKRQQYDIGREDDFFFTPTRYITGTMTPATWITTKAYITYQSITSSLSAKIYGGFNIGTYDISFYNEKFERVFSTTGNKNSIINGYTHYTTDRHLAIISVSDYFLNDGNLYNYGENLTTPYYYDSDISDEKSFGVFLGSAVSGANTYTIFRKVNTNTMFDADFGNSSIFTNPTFNRGFIARNLVGNLSDNPREINIYNNKIYICGWGSAAGSTGFIYNYNSDGTINNSFGTNGIVTQPSFQLYSMDIFNNNIYIYGLSGTNYYILKYVLSSGNLDLTFGTNGISTTIVGNANLKIKVLDDNNIILNGITSSSAIIYSISSDGNLNLSFGTNGRYLYNLDGAGYSSIKTCVYNSILYIPLGNSSTFSVLSVSSNGTTNTSFGSSGLYSLISNQTWQGVTLNSYSKKTFLYGSKLYIPSSGRLNRTAGTSQGQVPNFGQNATDFSIQTFFSLDLETGINDDFSSNLYSEFSYDNLGIANNSFFTGFTDGNYIFTASDIRYNNQLGLQHNLYNMNGTKSRVLLFSRRSQLFNPLSGEIGYIDIDKSRFPPIQGVY